MTLIALAYAERWRCQPEQEPWGAKGAILPMSTSANENRRWLMVGLIQTYVLLGGFCLRASWDLPRRCRHVGW